MRLENPLYLYGLLLVPIFIFLFILGLKIKQNRLNKFGDKTLLLQLMPDFSSVNTRFKFGLALLAFVFIVIGLANPQTGTKVENVKRKGVDIIIALDLSNSMLAEDIQPNRLERAKQAIFQLIGHLENDRIGLIVFGGQAYSHLPITSDYGAAKLFLSSVSTDLIPTQGTAIGAAIDLGIQTFVEEQKGMPKDILRARNKAIIVITDGENHEDDAIEKAKEAADNGIIVHTIGIGNTTGVPIPIHHGATVEYKKDNQGNPVITRLNEALLNDIAKSGNGIYRKASNANFGLTDIFQTINKMDKIEIGTKVFTSYKSYYQYFIGFGLLLLLLDIFVLERKNKWIEKLNIFGKQ